MVHKLETVKGGGGSIKLGTTGTISDLMSKELENKKSAPNHQIPSIPRTKAPFASSGSLSPKKLKPRTSFDEATSSSSSSSSRNKSIDLDRHEIHRKPKNYNRKTHQIPILRSGNVSLDGTPVRDKPDKKSSYSVEVVDIKCRNSDKKWAIPITNRLKKLGFSKLSETII